MISLLFAIAFMSWAAKLSFSWSEHERRLLCGLQDANKCRYVRPRAVCLSYFRFSLIHFEKCIGGSSVCVFRILNILECWGGFEGLFLRQFLWRELGKKGRTLFVLWGIFSALGGIPIIIILSVWSITYDELLVTNMCI